MMLRRKQLWLLVLLLVACEENEECRALKGLKTKYEETLLNAKKRAALKEDFEQRAADAERAAKATFERMGMDRAEEKLAEVVEARRQAVPGATVTRRVESYGPADEAPTNAKTIWTVTFRAKDPKEAEDRLWALLENPPLFGFEGIFLDPDGSWRVEISRAVVDSVPIDPKPVELDPLDDPEQVKSQFGFCGARTLRGEIEKLKTEIDALRADAERATVLLPTYASWNGLRHRAELLEKTELETRRLVRWFFEGTQKAKVRFKGIGFQQPRVILEVWGGAKEQTALEQVLGEERSRLKIPEDKKEGLIRLTVENTVGMVDTHQEPPLAPGRPGP